jgi:hypothetical protein
MKLYVYKRRTDDGGFFQDVVITSTTQWDDTRLVLVGTIEAKDAELTVVETDQPDAVEAVS